mgnify:CR=1 FL=1
MMIPPRTVGFIGTGHVVDYTLRTFLQQTQEDKEAEDLRQEFLRLVDRINIYFDDSRYEQGHKARIEGEYAFLEGILSSSSSAQKKLKVTTDFSEFYKQSTIIVDSAAEFGLRFYNQEPLAFVTRVKEAVESGNSVENIVGELYSEYKSTVQSPRKALPLEEFTDTILLGAETLEIMQNLERKEGHSFGPRTKNLLPFYLKRTLDRARELQRLTETNKEQELPFYIVFTNEPCLIATILTRYDLQKNFRMRGRMIASSGVDTARVLKICQEKYRYSSDFPEIMKELQYYVVLGRHDDGQNIAVLPPGKNMPSQEDEQRALDQINQRLETYWRDYQKTADFPLEWTLSILKTAVTALQSSGDGLSHYPLGEEVPSLGDGYYHQKSGLFLSGAYKVRNGFVEPVPVLPKAVVHFFSRVEQSSLRLVEELFAGPIRKYQDKISGGGRA